MAQTFDEDPKFTERLARVVRAFRRSSSAGEGDPLALEQAWGVRLPGAFHRILHAVDGGTLSGAGGLLELWDTRSNLALCRENYRAFRSTPGACVVFFGSDGGSYEYFFDVDGYFGFGPYAVLRADCASDHQEFVARGFLSALERLIDGPRIGDADSVSAPRPPGSERR